VDDRVFEGVTEVLFRVDGKEPVDFPGANGKRIRVKASWFESVHRWTDILVCGDIRADACSGRGTLTFKTEGKKAVVEGAELIDIESNQSGVSLLRVDGPGDPVRFED